MDNQSAFQTQPAYVQRASNRRRLVIIFLVVLLLIIAALGALYLLGSSAKKTTQPPTTPIPTAMTITATPTPASSSAQLTPTGGAVTPTGAKADVSTLTVSVLNGSGTPGAAGQTAAALKSAGYTTITTGNASSYTYTGITIHVKKNSYLSAVEKAISDAEPNAKITTGVDTTQTSDIEVIVGK